MSDNKMGGVPYHTRGALYPFIDKVKRGSDSEWAKVVERLTELGDPVVALKRLQDLADPDEKFLNSDSLKLKDVPETVRDVAKMAPP